MLKRLRKLIFLGVLSVSMLIPNTVMFAADCTTMELQEETALSEAETSAPQPDTTATEPDTLTPQPDIPTIEPDTPTPQPDIPTTEPETPAPQPDTPTIEPETPAPQPDTPATEPETPAPQPDTPATEPETPAPQPDTSATEPDTPGQTEKQKQSETKNDTEKPAENQKQTEPFQDPTLHTTDGTGVTANIIGFSVDPSKYPEANVGETTVFIYQYLTSNLGLNHAGACGILANIQLESNFNSLALGDGGSSYGICQWHNGRFNNLISYCNGNGFDYNTVEGQLQYLSHELAINYPSVLNYVRNVPDTAQGAYDAAYYWCMHFEVPDHTAERAAQRGNLAKNEYFGKSFSLSPKEVTTVQKVKTVRDQMDAKEILGDIRGQMNLENRLTNIRINAMLNH